MPGCTVINLATRMCSNFFTNSDPIYFWQQTSEDITVTVRMPQGATKGEVRFALTPDNISLGVQGFAPLLEGQLNEPVDPEASTWIIKDDKRFASLKTSPKGVSSMTVSVLTGS